MVLTEEQKQAIKKLDKEMEAAKDPCSKYIAEQLLQLATSCPEVSEKILEQMGYMENHIILAEIRLFPDIVHCIDSINLE